MRTNMEKIQIEGIATINEKGFHFDSGLPSNELVLDEALKMHGTLKVSKNACVDFQNSDRIYLPPEIHRVSDGEEYRVKRTSRHYLIQIKVPVVESRKVSEERINNILPVIIGDITFDRRETLSPALSR